MLIEKEIKVLVDLGLTSCQARVYLALCHFGELAVREISKYSSVSRQDIYRIAESLESLGLIERIISRPIRFNAMSIKKGIETLLKRKKKATLRLESDVIDILRDFKENQKQPPQSDFVYIPEREAVLERIRNAINNTKKSVDLLITWSRFKVGLYAFAEELKKAHDRKVKFRYIVEMPPNSEKKIISKLVRKHSRSEAKFLQTFPKCVMGIYDRKEIFVITDRTAGLQDSPALWSTCSNLVDALEDYFEILWMTSLPKSHLSLDKAERPSLM